MSSGGARGCIPFRRISPYNKDTILIYPVIIHNQMCNIFKTYTLQTHVLQIHVWIIIDTCLNEIIQVFHRCFYNIWHGMIWSIWNTSLEERHGTVCFNVNTWKHVSNINKTPVSKTQQTPVLKHMQNYEHVTNMSLKA